jgi:hypothetical protein
MAFLGLLVLVALFFLFRWVVLWYWRVDEIVDTQKAILVELREMNKARRIDAPVEPR